MEEKPNDFPNLDEKLEELYENAMERFNAKVAESAENHENYYVKANSELLFHEHKMDGVVNFE